MQLSASSLELLAWVMLRELISRPTTEGVVPAIAGLYSAVAPACVRRQRQQVLRPGA